MKSPYLIASLLLMPLLAWAEDAVLPVPPPATPTPMPAAAPDLTGPKQRAAAFRQHVLEKFDADKDGKLSDSERETAKSAWREKSGDLHAKALEKFDADKNGQLSGEEREALKTALKAGREVKAGKGEKGQLRDEARQRKMLEKFDADKDGQLNEAERANAREARKAQAAAIS